MKFIVAFFISVFIFIQSATVTAAEESRQFITIVNPVRISRYTKDPKGSVNAEYLVIRDLSLPATWLLTYDALLDEGVIEVVDLMNDEQELGIFLEISPAFSENAGVEYRHTGFWHHATSVFLSGYTQEERKKLIDTVFNQFEQRFGYYPVSVGSWWTDSFSLDYMKQEYSITANLGVADQYSTDGYQVWGQYWSTPFYPSKFHAGIPAANESVKLDIVTIQWAARDPINGYVSSLYSTQDYFLNPEKLGIEYFDKLISLFASKNENEFGHITIGLEADLEAEAYSGQFFDQLRRVKELKQEGTYKVVNMEEFSEWYRQNFTSLSPPHIVQSSDLLEKTDQQVIWYQSPNYRIGILLEPEGKQKIFDFRSYHNEIVEPYYTSPNREFELSIYIPSYFDEINNKEDVWYLELGDYKENKEGLLVFEKGTIQLETERVIVKASNLSVPVILSESPALSIIKNSDLLEININSDWIAGKDGLFIKDLSSEASHFLESKKVRLTLFIVLGTILSGLVFTVIHKKQKTFIVLTLVLITLSTGVLYWYRKNQVKYCISQGEIDALYRLSILPPGRVLVYDNECLQCNYQTNNKPAIFANKRNYIKKLGKHPIVYNSPVFEAETQSEARDEFEKLNADYIYISKFEDYIERVPFSPGDLGIEKIYDNANAEIWRVKEG